MVVVAQLVRASDCDSEGRRFEPGHPPQKILNPGLGFLFRFTFLCNSIIISLLFALRLYGVLYYLVCNIC